MSACEFCGVDHDAEDARADAAHELASLRERTEKAEAEVARLDSIFVGNQKRLHPQFCKLSREELEAELLAARADAMAPCDCPAHVERRRAEAAEAEVAKLTRERGMLYASLAASERLRILHSPIHGPIPTDLTHIKKALREIVRIGSSDASPAARIDRMKRAARAALSPSTKGMP